MSDRPPRTPGLSRYEPENGPLFARLAGVPVIDPALSVDRESRSSEELIWGDPLPDGFGERCPFERAAERYEEMGIDWGAIEFPEEMIRGAREEMPTVSEEELPDDAIEELGPVTVILSNGLRESRPCKLQGDPNEAITMSNEVNSERMEIALELRNIADRIERLESEPEESVFYAADRIEGMIQDVEREMDEQLTYSGEKVGAQRALDQLREELGLSREAEQ